MDTSLTSAPQRLAKNIESLRKLRKMSQMQLAELAKIPRSTLTHIESGSGNPSLQNLLKLAEALQVSVEELLSSPRPDIQLYQAANIPKNVRKTGTTVYKLLPDTIPGMEIDRMDFEPLSRMKGTPHLAQTKDYFYCVLGKIDIYVNKKCYSLNKGDLLSFPGDLPHAYVNPSKNARASGFSVVSLNHQYR